MTPDKKTTAAWLVVYTLILVVMLGTAFALRAINEPKPTFRTIATPTARTTLIPPETTTPRPP